MKNNFNNSNKSNISRTKRTANYPTGYRDSSAHKSKERHVANNIANQPSRLEKGVGKIYDAIDFVLDRPALKKVIGGLAIAGAATGVVAGLITIDNNAEEQERRDIAKLADIAKSAEQIDNVKSISIEPPADEPVKLRSDPGTHYIETLDGTAYSNKNVVGEISEPVQFSSDTARLAINENTIWEIGDATVENAGVWVGIPVDSISIKEAEQSGLDLDKKEIAQDPDGIVWVSQNYASINHNSDQK